MPTVKELKGSTLKEQMEELRGRVDTSINNTNGEIGQIDTSVLIGIVSLIAVLGLLSWLQILQYWIPASFLLFFVWIVWSVINSQLHRKRNNKEVRMTQVRIAPQLALLHIGKNLSPMTKAQGLIYVITAIAIVLFATNTLKGNSFPILLPIITALLLVFPALIADKIANLFNNENYSLTSKILNLKEQSEPKPISKLAIIFIVLLPIIILAEAILTYYAFWETYILAQNLIYLLIVTVLQLVLIISYSRYFGATSAKVALSNSISRYTKLGSKIDELLLEEDYTMEDYEKLKNSYFSAKPFDLYVDRSFIFIEFYTLQPNALYSKYVLKIPSVPPVDSGDL